MRWSPVATRRTHMNDVPQHMDVLPGHGTVRPHKYGIVTLRGYGLATLGEFGLVTPRDYVPGIYIPHRTRGCQLVNGSGSKPPAICTVLACDEILFFWDMRHLRTVQHAV